MNHDSTSLLDIKPGWAPSPYDWTITSAYTDVFQKAPGEMTVSHQLHLILNMFGRYREEFGQPTDIICSKCGYFYDEFGGCWCEDEEAKPSEATQFFSAEIVPACPGCHVEHAPAVVYFEADGTQVGVCDLCHDMIATDVVTDVAFVNVKEDEHVE